MSRKNCVYCDKEITTRSREHVIQNALGGLYESEDICCPECNNYISKHIDVAFTSIFNPILGNITDLGKTNNKNSTPSYTGTVLYNGNLYSANFKGGKIVSCPELSRELRRDISKLPLTTVSYDFNLQNTAFKTGVTKIAFNYALDRGIDLDALKPGLRIDKNGDSITKIEYNYPMLPFCPTNSLDVKLELGTPMELYHNMILFSQDNKLWCYIDLFNTFQYYVLLSETMPNNSSVYHNYMQTLQKPNRDVPKISIFRPKDAMIYAQQYGVQPSMDEQEMTRRIAHAIAIKSQKQPMRNIISKKLGTLPVLEIIQRMSPTQMADFWQSMQLYFDENDMLNERAFRTQTVMPYGGAIAPYPDAVAHLINNEKGALSQYTTAKFERLNAYLCNKSK